MEPVWRAWRTLLFLLRYYQWTQVPDWQPKDAEILASFLQTPVGKKLALRLRNASWRHNAAAVQDGSMRRCGVACGYMLALGDLSALSTSGKPGAVNPDLSEESLQEGEEDFLERMSP